MRTLALLRAHNFVGLTAAAALAVQVSGCALFESIPDVPPSGDASDGSVAESGDDSGGADATTVPSTDAASSDGDDASVGDSVVDSGGGEVAEAGGDDATGDAVGDGGDSAEASSDTGTAETSDACTSAPTCAGAQRVQCGSVIETCVSAALCTPTACTPPACALGDTKCVGTSFETCKSDRTGFGVSATCASAALCTSTGCGVPSCTSGSTRCSGNLFQTCKADGTGYANTATCATPALCSTSGCATPACAPTDTKCVGANFEICNPDQTGFVGKSTCVTSALCSTTGCKTPVCNVGDQQCVGQQHQKCNDPGRDGWFNDISVCTASQICSPTNGCMICTPGTHQCGGSGNNVYQTCASDGKSWTTTSTCATAALCSASSGCSAPVCTAGTTQCSGKFVQTCDATETKWNTAGTACAVDCQAGACVSVTQIAAATTWACAVESDKRVYCWGSNYQNQFGFASGTSTTSVSSPTRVLAAEPAIAIAGGASNGCTISDTATLTCWGANNLGQIGAGSTSATFQQPTVVPGLTNVSAVSVGDGAICAIAGTDSSVYCWGSNSQGQCGSGVTSSAVTSPYRVGLPGATSIAVESSHACAVWSGNVYCWGQGYLGDGSNHTTPVRSTLITGMPTIKSLLANPDDGGVLALGNDGSLYCWGTNYHATCGTGGSSPVSTPYQVLAASYGVSRVGFGGVDGHISKACAVTSSGTVCWGYSAPGGSLSPVADPSVAGFLQLVRGFDPTTYINFECMLQAGFSVSCASSDNSVGQLGDGTVTAHVTLAPVLWP